MEVPYRMGITTIFYNRKNIRQNKYKEIFKIEKLKKYYKKVRYMKDNKTNINWLACIYDVQRLNPYRMVVCEN